MNNVFYVISSISLVLILLFLMVYDLHDTNYNWVGALIATIVIMIIPSLAIISPLIDDIYYFKKHPKRLEDGDILLFCLGTFMCGFAILTLTFFIFIGIMLITGGMTL